MHFGFYFCFLSSSPLWLANHAFHTKEILWSIQHHRTHQRWRCTFILMALLWTFRLQVSLSRWTFYNQQKIMQTRQSTIRPFWAFSPYFFHLFFSSMCSSETVAVFGGYYDCVVQWYGLVPSTTTATAEIESKRLSYFLKSALAHAFFLHNKGHHIFESFFFCWLLLGPPVAFMWPFWRLLFENTGNFLQLKTLAEKCIECDERDWVVTT